MPIGYVRVSKSDGTQTLAPQQDAMVAAGVDPTRIYEGLAFGRRDARPGRDLRHLVNTVEDLRGQRAGWELAGSGCAIHWPELDEDLGTTGPLAGARPPRGLAAWRSCLLDRTPA